MDSLGSRGNGLPRLGPNGALSLISIATRILFAESGFGTSGSRLAGFVDFKILQFGAAGLMAEVIGQPMVQCGAVIEVLLAVHREPAEPRAIGRTVGDHGIGAASFQLVSGPG